MTGAMLAVALLFMICSLNLQVKATSSSLFKEGRYIENEVSDSGPSFTDASIKALGRFT